MYGPTVGVNSSRARMEVYSPDIAFKTPTVGIAYGDAYTAGPANYDTEAVTGAALQGPKISLDAPAAWERLQAPQGHFSTQAPSDRSSIQTTSDHKVHNNPAAYVRPGKW